MSTVYKLTFASTALLPRKIGNKCVLDGHTYEMNSKSNEQYSLFEKN